MPAGSRSSGPSTPTIGSTSRSQPIGLSIRGSKAGTASRDGASGSTITGTSLRCSASGMSDTTTSAWPPPRRRVTRRDAANTACDRGPSATIPAPSGAAVRGWRPLGRGPRGAPSRSTASRRTRYRHTTRRSTPALIQVRNHQSCRGVRIRPILTSTRPGALLRSRPIPYGNEPERLRLNLPVGGRAPFIRRSGDAARASPPPTGRRRPATGGTTMPAGACGRVPS